MNYNNCFVHTSSVISTSVVNTRQSMPTMFDFLQIFIATTQGVIIEGAKLIESQLLISIIIVVWTGTKSREQIKTSKSN